MEIALQPIERTTLEQITTLSPLRDAMLRASRYAQEAALLWRFQAGTDAWQTPAACEGTHTKSKSVSEGLYSMKGTHAGTVLKNCRPLETDHLSSLQTAVSSHGRDPTLEQGNSAGRKEQ